MRETLAAFLQKHYSKPVSAADLFVTNGISGGLALLCSVFLRSGDVVVVENPSYFLALSIFKDFGVDIVLVPIDEQGLRTDVLEEKLAKEGLRPKICYTIPTYQNPTSVIMSEERRKHLVKLASTYGFMVAADEVYQLLGFNGEPAPPAPLCYYDDSEHGCVISMGSFAKILAPAMRLGWFQTSPAGTKSILGKIMACGQLDSSGGVNPVMSGIADVFIKEGMQDAHLAAVKDELTRRATTLGDALRKYLPDGTSFEQPRGGYFIWIKLPEGLDGLELMNHAIAHHKVRFHPGERFGSGLGRFIRLSFSYYNAEDLALGAQRLGEAIRSLVALKKASAGSAAAAPATPAGPAPISVAVHGATGRLGKLIVESLVGSTPAAAADIGVPADTTFNFAGALGGRSSAAAGSGGGKDDEIIAASKAIVDVSQPAGTAALVTKLLASKNKPALVVGTTGDLPLDLLREYGKQATVILSANFSAGVPLLLSMIGNIKNLPEGWHAEVTEIHHTKKVDAPSGTAKRIVKALKDAGVRGSTSPATLAASSEAERSHGGSIPVHALRLGDTMGTHTVYLAGSGERLEVTHVATKRDVFALGALRTAAFAAKQSQPGFHVQ
jgi:2-aminoadipate transaminase